MLKLTDREMIVEAPMALGRQIEIEPEIELVASIAIGQNRWMFRTRNLGMDAETSQKSRSHRSLRLALPENVRRCQRRAPRFDTRDMKPRSRSGRCWIRRPSFRRARHRTCLGRLQGRFGV